MASGDTIWLLAADAGMALTGDAATPGVVDSGTYYHSTRQFEAGDDNYLQYQTVVPENYGGGDLGLYFQWSSVGTDATKVVTWGVQIERHIIGTTDMGAESFPTIQTVNDPDSATADLILESPGLTLTNAQADGILVGESIRMLVWRWYTGGSDDLGEKADFHRLKILEA